MSRLLPVDFRLYLVQPGVSKRAASPDQLVLLSVTENYLFEMYQLSFGVIASEQDYRVPNHWSIRRHA